MSRLQTQLHRLYHPQPGASTGSLSRTDLIDARHQTRALVLSLSRPADWNSVVRLWEGVQLDLNLPAPAIAVNGRDGYQLWFSTAAPLDLPQAHAFLAALQARYWPGIPPARVRAWPAPVSAAAGHEHSAPVPTLLDDTGQWSAFVARDLAPVFSDSPWLDIPPNPDGQADLLTPLRSIAPHDLHAAMALLAGQAPGASASASAGTPANSQAKHTPTVEAHAPRTQQQDPRRFLLGVMNDPAVDLALRIEAAKALLSAPQPRTAETRRVHAMTPPMNMRVFTINPATVVDADDVARMVEALLEEIMAAIGSPAFRFDLAETAARLRTYLAQGKYVVFVARDAAGAACGFIALVESHALYAEGAFGTIPELFVCPTWRSTSVGSQLIGTARQFAIDKGWRRLEVTTPPLPQFQRTLDFYERQGFSISGGRKLKIDIGRADDDT